MKIIPNFLSGNSYWQDKINTNAALASEVMSSPEFINRVRNWPMFDFTAETPAEIADKLEKAGEVQVNIGFYSKWWTRAIAYEVPGGVFINTRKESSGAGGPGNIAHEFAHSLGYEHDGNSPVGQENTTPWRFGQWVDEMIKARGMVPA